MDQVKVLLRGLSKYSFWIGCGVVLLISMASWFVARGSLQKEFQENKGKIDSSFTTVKNLKSKQSPPNEHSNKAMDALNAETLKKVIEAWAKQYSFQEEILRWPMELGADFVAVVRPLKPIETKVEVPTPPQKEIKVDFRQRYANYVERLLPRLAEVIESVWMPGAPPGGANLMPGMPGMPGAPLPNPASPAEQTKPIKVHWEPGDQGRLLGAHFNWANQPDSAPTTLQVLYAQEDLWVLTALMFIIHKTNGEIEGRHEAVVKTIDSVLIGRSAVGRAGQVIRLSSGQGMGPGMGPEMGPGGETGTTPYGSEGGEGTAPYNPYGQSGAAPGMPPGMPMGMPGEMGPGMDPGMPYGSGPTTVAADPADFRYVGNDYKPLPATRVRDAMKEGKPEDAFLVVAKRMPVRLRLTVDIRKLHRLLAACGNAALPVEIRQVRISRSGQSGSGMPGGYGMPGYGPAGGMEMTGGTPGGYYGSEGASPYGPGAGYGGGPGYGMTPGMEMGPGYGGPGYGTGYDQGGAGLSPDAMRNRTQISSTTSFDIPVEIYGIIYIYNPVDQQRLGVPDASTFTGTAPSGPSVSS